MEAQTFWRNIWGDRKKDRKDAEWLKVVRSELEQDEDQDEIDIKKRQNDESNEKDANRNARGPDNVQGY